MALTKVINDLADLNQSGSTNALKGCVGTTVQQPASTSDINYLIVGGGGAANTATSGGGGAGGLLTGTTTVYHGTPTIITIGEGGAIANSGYSQDSYNGNDSGFNGIRAIGGGAAPRYNAYGKFALPGGSGSGASIGTGDGASSQTDGGVGVSGQGNNGGANAAVGNSAAGGGGGGAGAVGTSGSSGTGGGGGIGSELSSFINYTNAGLAGVGEVSGTNVYFAGGGGAGGYSGATYTQTAGTGGLGGGGNGNNSSGNGEDGATNTGGGAGGGDGTSAVGNGGSGGSGVTVLKYDNTEVTGYTLNSEDTYTINWPAGAFGRAYWPLNLNVKDVGGNYDGTATDITYTNGKFNQAASFNGSSSYVTTSYNQDDTSAFSWSCWINITRVATSPNDNILGSMESGSPFNGVALFLDVDDIALSTNGSNIGNIVTNASTNTWYHIAVTYDGSGTFKTYAGGSIVSTISQTPVDGGNFWFGDGGPSSWNSFDGLIEQIRIYSGVLTESNIADIYNNSKPGTLPPLKTASDITTSTCNFPSGVTGTALYQFEANANDSCTVGPYDGTFTNPVYGIGKFGTYAASFNGSSSKIDLPNLGISGAGTRTISAWVNTNSLSGAQTIFQFGTSAAKERFGFAIDTAGKVYVEYYGRDAITSSAYITVNNWFHVAATYNGGAIETGTNTQIYVNGVAADMTTTGSSTGAAATGNSDYGIGYRRASSSQYFNGSIDQLRVYSSALTAEQIYDLWQKENDIQTYFPDTPTSGTDTLVFKSGSGEISFINDTAPGAEVGMLRYNSTLGQMEHFNSGGWKSFSKVINSVTVDYLVVAGGASGGTYHGGGGGAGGLRTSYGTVSPITLNGGSMESPLTLFPLTNYIVTVGAGGAGVGSNTGNIIGNAGSDSVFSSITSTGGGYGSSVGTAAPGSGGSGGGGNDVSGASAVTSPVIQGHAGGNGIGTASCYAPGGGGGAGSVGVNANGCTSGNGGDGLEVNIIGGTGNYYAGGGGGGIYLSGTPGTGGSSIGGNGGPTAANTNGFPGVTNTGSGGGGANAGISQTTGSGGSGVIILRYPSVYSATYTAGGGGIADPEQIIGSTGYKYIRITAGTGTVSFS